MRSLRSRRACASIQHPLVVVSDWQNDVVLPVTAAKRSPAEHMLGSRSISSTAAITGFVVRRLSPLPQAVASIWTRRGAAGLAAHGAEQLSECDHVQGPHSAGWLPARRLDHRAHTLADRYLGGLANASIRR